MNIKMDTRRKRAVVSQTGYLDKYIEDNRVRATRTASPSGEDLFQADTEEKAKDPERFRSNVMRLMYLAKRTRPDVLKEISYLATKTNDL